MGSALSNIEITEANIGAFKPCAKKYGVDFTLRKDKHHPTAPVCRDFQIQGRGQSGTGVSGVYGQDAFLGAAAIYPQAACRQQTGHQPEKGGGQNQEK